MFVKWYSFYVHGFYIYLVIPRNALLPNMEYFATETWPEYPWRGCSQEPESTAAKFFIKRSPRQPPLQRNGCLAVLVGYCCGTHDLCKLNRFIARNEALDWGKLRNGSVGISGTDYMPPVPDEKRVREEFNDQMPLPQEKRWKLLCGAHGANSSGTATNAPAWPSQTKFLLLPVPASSPSQTSTWSSSTLCCWTTTTQGKRSFKRFSLWKYHSRAENLTVHTGRGLLQTNHLQQALFYSFIHFLSGYRPLVFPFPNLLFLLATASLFRQLPAAFIQLDMYRLQLSTLCPSEHMCLNTLKIKIPPALRQKALTNIPGWGTL